MPRVSKSNRSSRSRRVSRRRSFRGSFSRAKRIIKGSSSSGSKKGSSSGSSSSGSKKGSSSGFSSKSSPSGGSSQTPPPPTPSHGASPDSTPTTTVKAAPQAPIREWTATVTTPQQIADARAKEIQNQRDLERAKRDLRIYQERQDRDKDTIQPTPERIEQGRQLRRRVAESGSRVIDYDEFQDIQGTAEFLTAPRVADKADKLTSTRGDIKFERVTLQDPRYEDLTFQTAQFTNTLGMDITIPISEQEKNELKAEILRADTSPLQRSFNDTPDTRSKFQKIVDNMPVESKVPGVVGAARGIAASFNALPDRPKPNYSSPKEYFDYKVESLKVDAQSALTVISGVGVGVASGLRQSGISRADPLTQKLIRDPEFVKSVRESRAVEREEFTGVEKFANIVSDDILGRDKETFEKDFSQRLRSQGYSEEDIKVGLDVAKNIRSIETRAAVGGAVTAEVVGEVTGAGIFRNLTRGKAVLTHGSLATFKHGFQTGVFAIAPAGFLEGVSAVGAASAARGEVARPIDLAIGGGVGAFTAGTIGGTVTGLQSVATRSAKATAGVLTTAVRVVDPFETAGDVIGGVFHRGVASPVVVTNPLYPNVRGFGMTPGSASSELDSPVGAVSVTPSQRGAPTTRTPRETSLRVGSVPSLTPIIVPDSTVPVRTPPPTRTPTRVPSRTPTRSSSRTSVTTPTIVPTTTPTITPTLTPTRTPTLVPTLTPAVTRSSILSTVPTSPFPSLPGGFRGFGRRGRGKKFKQRKAYTPDLTSAILHITSDTLPKKKKKKGKKQAAFTGFELRPLTGKPVKGFTMNFGKLF